MGAMAIAPDAHAVAITFSGASVMGVNAGGVGVGYGAGENSTGVIRALAWLPPTTLQN
jgi:hypothetical protein